MIDDLPSCHEGERSADVSDEGPSRGAPGVFDPICEQLQRLRTEAGLPSYNEIVVRIGRLRTEQGVPPEAARPARTTVYDAFRTGRRRLDAQLVGDIVRALGRDEAEALGWEDRVRAVRAASEVTTPSVAVPAASRADHPASATDATDATDATPLQATTASSVSDPAAEEPPIAWRHPLSLCLAIALAAVGVNLVGRALVDFLDLSIYLDMVGTAIAAITLGPWWGVGVGVSTNLIGTAGEAGPTSIPFALVNGAGALMWGYGVRRFGMGRTLARYLVLNLLTALVCSLVATPIIVALDLVTMHGADATMAALSRATGAVVLAVLTVNLMTSTIDKLISGFVAMVVASSLRQPIDAHPPRRRV